MPTYRISYKCYYHEHSEYGHEDIVAASEEEALRLFIQGRLSELKDIDDYDGQEAAGLSDVEPSRLKSWWEGDWLIAYRGIHETDMVQCPVCHGEREVPREIAQQFAPAST